MVPQRWIARSCAIVLALPVSLQADTLYLAQRARASRAS